MDDDRSGRREREAEAPEVLDEGLEERIELCASCTAGSPSART